jgi:hypothetical protein
MTTIHDAAREIRAMILSAFACPPLPLMVVRDSTQTDDCVSSHDIIACAMQSTNDHYTAANEMQRVNTQKKLLQDYNDTLDLLYLQYKNTEDDAMRRRKVVTDVYDVMQDYTRKMIASYMLLKDKQPDARFVPLDDVCISDTVYTKAKEHLVANRIICDRALIDPSQIDGFSYRELIEKFFVLYSEDLYM